MAQNGVFFAFGGAYELVGESYVGAFVGRHSEVAFVASAVRCSSGQTVG